MALPGPNWRTENHLVTLTPGSTTVLQNAYDGDGARVVRTANGQATHYVGGAYEYNVTTQTATTHCSFNGTPTAMKQGLTVTYLTTTNWGASSRLPARSVDGVLGPTYSIFPSHGSRDIIVRRPLPRLLPRQVPRRHSEHRVGLSSGPTP